MQIQPKLHLTYCTNIHPAESWPDVEQSLHQYVPPLKDALAPDRPFGIGLRLSNEAGAGLSRPAALAAFREWLSDNDCYVFTMNGFPYGGFHRQVVKDQVHAPDWRRPERPAYTLRLFDILSALLPEGVTGGISTSPLSYKPWLKSATARDDAFDQATENVLRVVEHLWRLHQEKGRLLHLDIEPEPDGLLENSAEFIAFFNDRLLVRGREYFKDKMPDGAIEDVIRRHVNLCYDVCHFAVGYEAPAEAIGAFRSAGIAIGKVQISAALKVRLPEKVADREPIRRALAPFNESTYLHQVVARTADGRLEAFPDLPPALDALDRSDFREWRTHFHVPIFVEEYGLLASTQKEIVKVLELLKAEPFTGHLEVETYTWEVLPEGLQVDLTESIRREVEWVCKWV